MLGRIRLVADGLKNALLASTVCRAVGHACCLCGSGEKTCSICPRSQVVRHAIVQHAGQIAGGGGGEIWQPKGARQATGQL